ncbi:hypothetical protein AB0N07_44740 [Streptomyces sp. NPDC051172]
MSDICLKREPARRKKAALVITVNVERREPAAEGAHRPLRHWRRSG